MRSFTRFWIILAVTGLLVGLILSAWFLSLRVTQQEVLETYNLQQLALVEGAAVGIETVFDDLRTRLSAIALLPDVIDFDEAALRATFVAEFGELNASGISELGFLDEDGAARIFVARPDLERVDYSWRRYFKEASNLDPGQEALVVELDTRGQESALLLALPVFDPAGGPEAFRGVVLVTFSVSELVERYLLPFEPPGSGQIFLVHDDLEVIWSSVSEMQGRNLQSNRTPALLEMGDEMTAWTREDEAGGMYIYEYIPGRNPVDLVAYAPVKLGGERLAIGVQTPGDVARRTSFTAFQRQQTVLLISVFILVLGVGLGGVVLNVETRRRFAAEEALRKSERDQAVLAERNRLAGDLHDSVTQSLYGIVLHADAARANLAAGKKEITQEYLAEISSAGKEGLAEMRMLIFELRPPVLAEEGLEAALETRLYAVERRVGLQADLDWHIEERLPEAIEEGLYRIAREALNNVLKHTAARHLSLDFAVVAGAVVMRIEDDGPGFDPEDVAFSGGMGLQGMKERAIKMGGTLKIESRPGEGTRIIVEVPDGTEH